MRRRGDTASADRRGRRHPALHASRGAALYALLGLEALVVCGARSLWRRARGGSLRAQLARCWVFLARSQASGAASKL